MNKTFVFASLIAAIVLALAYWGFLPSYISVTISICVFVTALSYVVNSASRYSIAEIKEAQDRNKSDVLKAFDKLYERLELLSHSIEKSNDSVFSELENICKLMTQNQIIFDDMSKKFEQSMTDLSSDVCKRLDSIDKKNESHLNALDINSSEISKLNTLINSLSKEIHDSSAIIKTSTEFHSERLGKSIENVSCDLQNRIEYVVNSLNSLNECVETFTVTSHTVKESYSTLSSEISNSIKSMMELGTSISRGNNRLIEDLKDHTSNNLEELLKGIKNSNVEQTEYLSESEDKIRQSVNKLCNNITSNLQKLGIDIESICESVEDMKKMSQYVEQADKNLLSQITKLCKK